MEIDPPDSLPTMVRREVAVCDNDEFGMNLNLRPSATCAVVDDTSPINVGMVAVVVDCNCSPIIVPRFLLDRIAV